MLALALCHRYATGEELSSSDAEFVVDNALRYHPKAAAKMGEQVIGIKVRSPAWPCSIAERRPVDRLPWERGVHRESWCSMEGGWPPSWQGACLASCRGWGLSPRLKHGTGTP